MTDIKKLCATVCTVLLAISAFNTAHAQLRTTSSSPISWGLKAGLTFSNVYESGQIDFRTNEGFMIGGFVNYDFRGFPLSLQPEVHFIRKGPKRFAASYQNDYIQIPVLAKLYIGSTGSISYNLVAGPYAAFPVNSTLQRVGRSDVDFTDELEFDYGGSAGVVLELFTGGGKLIFEGNYQIGIADAFLTDPIINPVGNPVKNSVIVVTMGYGF